ncbi:ornithine aminotransferase [Saitoella coloradoensis]
MHSREIIALEHAHSAHNYHPLPIVFDSAKGATVTDPEGKEYLDFLSAYSAVNQGHCHPRVINALVTQAQKLTLSSRAFHSSTFGPFAAFVTKLFGYERVLPMNTGAEAVETAIKLARRWGYLVKKIPSNKAIVLSARDNFHGRTLGVISMSTDPDSTTNFGPYLPAVGPTCPAGCCTINYDSIPDLEAAFAKHGPEIAAFLIEPIQGEAGIRVPHSTYLPAVRELCTRYNILLIADEIQTGIARTGRMLASDHASIRPDVVLLGKAVSGGVYPVSCVLADRSVMDCFEPGSHGSTYGGNPLGCAVAMEALQVVLDEKLCERAERLGTHFRNRLRAARSPLIAEIRGMGLLNAIVIDETKTNGKTAWQFCLLLKSRGVLAKPTHVNIIRLAPPLVIGEEEMERGLDVIIQCLEEFPGMDRKSIQDIEDEYVPGEEN